MGGIIIKNVFVVDPLKTAEGVKADGTADIFIKDGVFAGTDTADGSEVVIDGSGLKAAPGLIDLHVHLRDPGQTEKEDIMKAARILGLKYCKNADFIDREIRHFMSTLCCVKISVEHMTGKQAKELVPKSEF